MQESIISEIIDAGYDIQNFWIKSGIIKESKHMVENGIFWQEFCNIISCYEEFPIVAVRYLSMIKLIDHSSILGRKRHKTELNGFSSYVAVDHVYAGRYYDGSYEFLSCYIETEKNATINAVEKLIDLDAPAVTSEGDFYVADIDLRYLLGVKLVNW